MWKPIDGAEYYLVFPLLGGQKLSANSSSIAQFPSLEPYKHDDNCVLIRDTTELNLMEVIMKYGIIKYGVFGYSDSETTYTPKYDMVKSKENI